MRTPTLGKDVEGRVMLCRERAVERVELVEPPMREDCRDADGYAMCELRM